MRGMDDSQPLALDVDDDELTIMRAVRDWVPFNDGPAVTAMVERGILDRVAGSAPRIVLAPMGWRTLWQKDRRGAPLAPWEHCMACGRTNLSVERSWGPKTRSPVRVDCGTCGYTWTPG
jgi:hypothetical protein